LYYRGLLGTMRAFLRQDLRKNQIKYFTIVFTIDRIFLPQKIHLVYLFCAALCIAQKTF